MANLNNVPFNSLSNDDLFDLLRPALDNIDINNDPVGQYDVSVGDTFNALSEELNLDFHFDDPAAEALTRYITNKQFHDVIKDYSNDIFSLLHFNIRSLNKHFDDLQLLLDAPSQTPLSIIGLTETWLTQDVDSSHALNEYEFVCRNRQDRLGGGVAMYVLKRYNYIVHDNISLMSDLIESLFIEIIIPDHKNILVGVIYRPPNSSLKEFLSYVTDLIKNPLFENKDCFLMGDFNINLLKHAENNVSHEFLEILLSASFLPLVSKPTRVADSSATLIDNIFSNVIPHPNSYIILSDISDHYPILTQYNAAPVVKRGGPPRLIRKVTHANVARLGASLDNTDWSAVFDKGDVNSSYDTFINIFNSQLDTDIPQQRDKSCNYKTSPRLPWISKSLLRSINRKNNLYYKYKLKGTDKLKLKYTSYKNILIQLIRLEKRRYFVNRLELSKNDMQKTWKIIKQAMNLNKNKPNITRIRQDNVIVDDPGNISNIFNEYFSSIGENLAQNIPASDKHFVDFLGNPNPDSIFFVPIHKYEILDIVSNLDNKKSSGYDGVNNFLLKGIIVSIVDPLVHIFNLSLLNGQVPDIMKIAKVVPLFKKGDKLEVCNYRPISLLSTLSKVLEKIIYTRTVSFFKNNAIFSNFQFGFREKHSTVHALLSFVDKVAHAIDNSLHTVGIFLDFSKAFDTINHNILLYKLSHYGIRGKALEWFRSYLSNRKQYVSLNDVNSEFRYVTCGVPQGSLLGPLLFIIYINDFCKSSDKLSFILFADDTNLFFSHRNPHTLVETINIELFKISQWIRANKLSLNFLKTKFMLFSKSIDSLPLNIVFDNNILENVPIIKFLGVIVDNKLSWKYHIDSICKTISRNIGVIKRLKSCLPMYSLLMLYSSLILPYLNYGLLAWGNTHQSFLDRLLLLQKRIIRIICDSTARSHTDPLFFNNKLLKINELYLYQLGQFMYKYDNKSLPSAFDSMFFKNQSVHNYPTRQSNEFHLPLLRTLLAQNTFIYDGPKFWNTIDIDIKNVPSLNSFKRKLKLYLLQRYQ